MDLILQTIIKYVLGILGVGTIVILHEFGHFIAAHINGIEVEIFSLGLGPKLFGKQFGNTEYRLSLVPFGGYCRLKGSDDLTRALDKKSKQFDHIEHGSLFSVKPINRLFTYLAGPISNVIVSIILCSILASLSYKTLSTPCYVAPVTDYEYLFSNSTSPASESGIMKGDKVIMIDDKSIRDYQEMATYLSENKKQDLLFTVERDIEGEKTLLEFLVSGAETDSKSFRYGLTNIIDTKVSSVRFFSPEYKAGLQKKDTILKVNNKSVKNNLDLLTVLSNEEGSIINLTLLRNNKTIEISYTPDSTGNKFNNKFSLYSPTRTIDGLDFSNSIIYGTQNAISLFSNTVKSLLSVIKSESDDVRQVFTGPMRASLMIGDITIMGFENSIASGLRALCYLLAVVSISIAIANLLPLPAFDGGQILIAFLEIITRRRISPANYWRCQLVGMIGVICIFAFLYFIDLRYFYILNFAN